MRRRANPVSGPERRALRLASFIATWLARVTAGAFILNSGISKLPAGEQTAGGRYQMAAGGSGHRSRNRPPRVSLPRTLG
jgi:hypothetical protein